MIENLQSIITVPEIEISYRNNVKPNNRIKVNSSSSAYQIFLSHWDMNKIELVEQFSILLLDRNTRCLGIATIATGGISACVADPKIIFSTALKTKASGVILAHNHPSGSLTPSKADLALTQKLICGGAILDISVPDHLIITPYDYYSFADDGNMHLSLG